MTDLDAIYRCFPSLDCLMVGAPDLPWLFVCFLLGWAVGVLTAICVAVALPDGPRGGP